MKGSLFSEVDVQIRKSRHAYFQIGNGTVRNSVWRSLGAIALALICSGNNFSNAQNQISLSGFGQASPPVEFASAPSGSGMLLPLESTPAGVQAQPGQLSQTPAPQPVQEFGPGNVLIEVPQGPQPFSSGPVVESFFDTGPDLTGGRRRGNPERGIAERLRGGRITGASQGGATRGKTFSMFGGWNFDNEQNYRNYYYYDNGLRMQDGNIAGFSFGNRVNSNWRSDLEFSWRRGEATVGNDFIFFGTADVAVDIAYPFYGFDRLEGELNAYSGIFNVYYDFDRPRGKLLTPYVGAGIGVTYLDVDVSHNNNGSTVSNQTSLAFQATGGMSARLTPRSEFFVEYRFLLTANEEFEVPRFVGQYYTSESYAIEDRLSLSNLVLGLRFTF